MDQREITRVVARVRATSKSESNGNSKCLNGTRSHNIRVVARVSERPRAIRPAALADTSEPPQRVKRNMLKV